VNRGSSSRGFTILEILLAVAISAMVLTAGYWSYSTVLGSSRRYRESADSFQMARVVLGSLERELAGAYLPLLPGYDPEEDDLPPLFVTDDGWAGGLEADRLDLVTTTFLRRGGGESLPGYDSYEVGYYLEDGKLMMRVAPYFNPEEPFEDGREIVLAEGVRALDFKYFSVEEESWLDEWDLEEFEVLPRAVQVTVALGEEDEEEPRRFSLAAWIPAGGSKELPEEER